MGFSYRKSVSVGPFRFNLSGSGVGMSVGVRGFRVGTGPRGNYVRMGLGGVSYHHTLPRAHAPTRVATPALLPLQTSGPDAASLADSSSMQLLEQIRAARSATRITLPVIVGAFLFFLYAASTGSADFILFAFAVGIAAIAAAKYSDVRRRHVVVLYDLQSQAAEAFHRLLEWSQALAVSERLWHVEASGGVYDWKYNAGASPLVPRELTRMRFAAPPYLRTNVAIPSLALGARTLYFLPDRLLIDDGRSIGALAYRSLELSVTESRMIQTPPAPFDALVVGYTWRYVNRDGGPDRRFASNPRLPICLYDELQLRSAGGLQEVVQVSQSGIAEGFAAAVRFLGGVTAQTQGNGIV
ncbi:MAG: DUF4236 domain-containing protein [Acidobacteria bacterium]|nr:DUF4236 domain-containing protein [Acidobacteriota bacterium]MBV9476279.1 DUF4236 domain-containing protein [Acidobacteriota bacterium]